MPKGDGTQRQPISLPTGDRKSIDVINGDFHKLSKHVQDFIIEQATIMAPRDIHICDGSQEEADSLGEHMIETDAMMRLDKLENCFYCNTDPADVARVESKTFLVTVDKYSSVPHVADDTKGILAQWMSPEEFEKESAARFPGCMAGRTMFVIPFSMGPIGSPLSKIGLQLTDFAYVVLCMRIMTRIGIDVLKVLNDAEYVQGVHSVGCPKPLTRELTNNWPCNPAQVLIAHLPDRRRIVSYGSGYGGNSLLGKKCFALRIANRIAKDEGWLAEHMLITGVTNPAGEERFIAAAFPSACGKTNMAMMEPTLPGWKVRVVGDDIAWMRFDKEGRLRAINPEAGFFGVAPGTNHKTNPIAMDTASKNCIYTNVAMTGDGNIYWEGLEKETDHNAEITTWLGKHWHIGEPGVAAHPNSRFCCPAGQCPIIHPRWEDPEGVPIDAIIFGGRRPTGVPLIVESNSWEHGVMLAAAVKSEATAAAEFKGKAIMHDPMAMRPFVGYNFGSYLQHWLSMNTPGRHMPKIYHANWFRVDSKGDFLWPGFGDNIRVVDWIVRRLNGEDIADMSPIGGVPKPGSINTEGLGKIDEKELYSVPKDYWVQDMEETKTFLTKQVGSDLPQRIIDEIDQQTARVNALP